MAVWHENGFV
jgi:hypothetical protein